MRLNDVGLIRQLEKALPGLIWIDSDDDWQRLEIVKKILAKAESAGFKEKHRFSAKEGIDFNALDEFNQNLSLFQDKKVFEITLADTVPPKLIEWLGANVPVPADTLIIITSNRLDAKTQKASWFAALEKEGIVVTLWPVSAEHYPAWLNRRAREKGVQLGPVALKMIAEQTEGNLFAADQLLDKLQLLAGDQSIDEALLAKLIGSEARYQLYDLTSALLKGERARLLTIMQRFQEEGEDILPLLGLICREMRLIGKIKRDEQTKSLAQIFRELKLWEKRQNELKHALERLNYSQCLHFMKQAAEIDKAAKGIIADDPWQLLKVELVQLC